LDNHLAEKMRFRLGAAMLFITLQPSYSQPSPCEQAAFAAVVSEASGTLATMNEENKRAFQTRLASLKTREGWADAEYAAKAGPFAKDKATTALDEGNKALLAKVPQLGAGANLEAAGAAGSPELSAKRCAMLQELRGLMAKVVENTKAKWTHMLGKLDAALDVSRQAKVSRQQ
jgi:hypothetical protein